jgi:transcriptional regulator with XRE-family HTH domain
LIVRALRRRRGWRQADLAAAAGVSQATVSRFERGHIDQLAFAIVRRILRPLEARADLDLGWRGGQAERLVDERSALLGVHVTDAMHMLAWTVLPEVTFAHHGERGSIDVFAARAEERAVCVIELKSAVHSYEETQRRLDVKQRLASDIAFERLGWRPHIVGAVLVVEDTRANRSRLRGIDSLLRAGLPASSREVRRWLARPEGSLRGLWFVRVSHQRTVVRRRTAPERVQWRRRHGPEHG